MNAFMSELVLIAQHLLVEIQTEITIFQDYFRLTCCLFELVAGSQISSNTSVRAMPLHL